MLGQTDVLPRPVKATLSHDIAANGPREHYMRAQVSEGTDGRMVTVYERQDSALLTVLAGANALLIRPIKDAPCKAGARMDVILL